MVIGWLCRRTIIVFQVAQGCDTCKTPESSASRVSERPEASSDHQGIKLTQENAHGSSPAPDGGMENRNGTLAGDWKTGVG